MPKKKADTPDKLRPDANEIAFRVLREATGDAEKTLPLAERRVKNSDAAKRGAKGGEKGGKARAARMSEAERVEIAKHAARVRWQSELD